MDIPANKKVVCITGSVWTGSRSAPRHMLVRDGFVRPVWFTTGRPLTDAQYRQVSEGQYRIARAKRQVLAHVEYRASFIGVMRDDFEAAMAGAEQGVLVVGPPEIAAQLASAIPQAIVFSLKDRQMDLCGDLDDARRSGQFHRIDVDALAPGAWTDAHDAMLKIIGLPVKY
jgi:hypothetical protein